MTATGRVGSEYSAAWNSFLRRRTAVFFTFFFPLLLVLIFGVLVQTNPGGGGLFSQPSVYYIPGYLAVVVLFTPLSRVGSEIARHRDDNRFEKLATTPLTNPEWMLAQTLVNVVVIGIAALLILALTIFLTGAKIVVSPMLILLIPFVALAVALFCGLGAILGRISDSQDGVVAASNGVAIPLLFLSETFVSPNMLPGWFQPIMWLSPLTYFARGVRAVTEANYQGTQLLPSLGGNAWFNLVVLAVLAVIFFAAGAYAIPTTE